MLVDTCYSLFNGSLWFGFNDITYRTLLEAFQLIENTQFEKIIIEILKVYPFDK